MTLELLARYLQSIKTYLPRASQDDILRELSENLRCQMEDKEMELGRPLTEAEQAEVLKQHGHPIVVAVRYGRAQYLIGPAVFPFYWLILRISAAGALVARFLVAVALALAGNDPRHAIVPALLKVPGVLIPVFFWVTGTFAAIELGNRHFHLKGSYWDPATLPSLRRDARSIPHTESVARIIFGGLGILWWQALPVAPFLLFGPAAHIIGLAPIWTALHWPILLLIVAGVVQASIDLAQPQLSSVRVGMRLLLRAAELFVLCLVLRADAWIVAAPEVHDAARYAGAIALGNRGLFYGFLVGLVAGGVQLAWDCFKEWRASSAHYSLLSGAVR
jgi:hypothetical protein